MGQRIHKVTLIRLCRIAQLRPNELILISDNAKNRKKISDMLFKVQTVGYKRLGMHPAITADNIYHIFEKHGSLYVARIK